MSKPWKIRFTHGLGDCVNFAQMLPLWQQAGHAIAVQCSPDKRPLFDLAGAKPLGDRERVDAVHPWQHPPVPAQASLTEPWAGNKAAFNLVAPEMPKLAANKGGRACCPDLSELWPQWLQLPPLDGRHLISNEAAKNVNAALKGLRPPLILLHTRGNTGTDRKNVSPETEAALYRELLDRCDGTLLLLDWDRRVTRLPHYRCRHLEDLGLARCDLPHLAALYAQAELLIGIDSGPLHFARLFSDLLVLGVWRGHFPSHFALPSPRALHLVPRRWRQWTIRRRIDWPAVETPTEPTAEEIATAAADLLAIGDADWPVGEVLLQRLVRLTRNQGGALSDLVDRDRTFAAALWSSPRRIVETGCIRAEEDWGGAGFSTYLFGLWLATQGTGTLDSVDTSTEAVRFARQWCAGWPHVRIHQADSLAWLAERQEPIDLLYLDSLDTTDPRHAEHCLAEYQAAERLLHEGSRILIDDTVWRPTGWTGKGGLLVPHLLANGWRIVTAGYQVLLRRA